MSALGWAGWTKTPFFDFQNERLLSYFMVFLLGAAFSRAGILDSDRRNMKLFIAVNATAWIPINLYVIVVLNYILRPGKYLVSEGADLFLLYLGFHLSMLALMYCAVATFKNYFRRQGRFERLLAELSYPVYVIHMAVMGPIALMMLQLDLPGIVKYPVLTITTWAACNLIVIAWRKLKSRLTELKRHGEHPSQKDVVSQGSV